MNKTKRLLQLNVTANWGSTGKIAEGIGVCAIKKGWDSTITFGRYCNASASRLIKSGTSSDVYAHFLKDRLIDGEGLGSYSPTKSLLRKISEYKPDIVQLHNIHDHWLNYPILFDWLSHREMPVVWTFHDCWAFTGGCPHFEGIGCFDWKNGCNDCPRHRWLRFNRSRRNYRQKLLSFGALEKRLTIVTVSEWLADYVKQSFLGKCKIEVIHNGVDTQRFIAKDSAVKQKMVLGVSNVWPAYKGLSDFIKLREMLPDDIKITLVGLDKKQIASLPDGITGISRTSCIDELIALYQQASVFVNPSLYDSFPTVNLEALACGTPVITYRTGGCPEAVDSNTGIVVDKGDINSLTQAIIDVIENRKPISGDDCRRRATSCFNKDIQFNKYIELYDELLTNR